jgi:hypothetical protein
MGKRLLRKDVEQIDRYVTIRVNEPKLNKMDRAMREKLLKIHGGWSWTQRFYYDEIEKKLLKHPVNVWKKTNGNPDEIRVLVDTLDLPLVDRRRIMAVISTKERE